MGTGRSSSGVAVETSPAAEAVDVLKIQRYTMLRPATPRAVDRMAIPLFASVVAGGTALTGGVGGPHRTLLGVIIITWTQAGMTMLAIGRDVQMVVFGIIAIGTSIATIDRRRLKIMTIK